MDQDHMSTPAPRWGFLLAGSVMASYLLTVVLVTAALAATFAAAVAATVSDSPTHHGRAAWGVASFGGLLGVGAALALRR